MIVQESKWSKKTLDNKLFDGEKYDIMGFFGKFLGLSDNAMLDKTSLSQFNLTNLKYKNFKKEDVSLEWLEQSCNWGKHEFKNVYNLLMYLNDNPDMTPYQKKQNLTTFFQRVGIKIEWKT